MMQFFERTFHFDLHALPAHYNSMHMYCSEADTMLQLHIYPHSRIARSPGCSNDYAGSTAQIPHRRYSHDSGTGFVRQAYLPKSRWYSTVCPMHRTCILHRGSRNRQGDLQYPPASHHKKRSPLSIKNGLLFHFRSAASDPHPGTPPRRRASPPAAGASADWYSRNPWR